MTAFNEKKNFTIENVGPDAIDSFSSTYFSYDPMAEALMVRRDLAYLMKCLTKIKDYRKDQTILLDFERENVDREVIVIEGDSDPTTEGVAPYIRNRKMKKKAKTKKEKVVQTWRVHAKKVKAEAKAEKEIHVK